MSKRFMNKKDAKDNLVIVTDLFSLKYNESEEVAISTLKQICGMPCRCAALIVPNSIIHLVPKTWEQTNRGKQYAEQGIYEDAWIVMSHKE